MENKYIADQEDCNSCRCEWSDLKGKGLRLANSDKCGQNLTYHSLPFYKDKRLGEMVR